jgi:hypothetical protein
MSQTIPDPRERQQPGLLTEKHLFIGMLGGDWTTPGGRSFRACVERDNLKKNGSAFRWVKPPGTKVMVQERHQTMLEMSFCGIPISFGAFVGNSEPLIIPPRPNMPPTHSIRRLGRFKRIG